MNPVAEEILSYYTGDVENEEALEHYGMPRRSGRYPWGSGEDPYQHERDFLGRVDELRKSGFTFTDEKGKTWTGDTAIAKSMGLSTTEFRAEIGLAKDERRMLNVAKAKSLKADGLNATEIGREMGVNESTVRSWLNAESESRMMQAKQTADFLRERSEALAKETGSGMIDVGKGAALELNVSNEKLKQALYILKKEGYTVQGGGVPQVTNPGQQTNQLVLIPPGVKPSEIYGFTQGLDNVHTIKDYITRDGGETFEKKFNYPASLDSKRLQIRYKEEGGIDKDGIIELRRGVDDLSLGESRYSQVRILVDGTHYLKGMAVYSDNMPYGVDVVFNTNKTKGTPMTDVLKKIKDDPDNPFGSLIKDADQGGQYWYTDEKTGEKKLGLINKRSDEGDWTDWKDALPSQFLAKQSISLAKKQLDLAKASKLDEYYEICALENPTIKKHLLGKFADECDSAAVHLQAAALPGQKYHVIIPINTLKDTEVYAPQYESGTKLALIRYPHGGTFEIPILTVNNKNRDGQDIIGNQSIDAVGINKKIADRLSGADFDGDTVMCIPTHDKAGRVKIISTNKLQGLEGFEPKDAYGTTKQIDKDTGETIYVNKYGTPIRVMKNTQTEMGKISNLITDMTLAGADSDDLAKAVRHSMVVIDAEKHKLDYKQSEIDNQISALKKKYRTYIDEDGVEHYSDGASTIISRAKGQTQVEKRQGSPKVNIKGKEWYDPSRPEGALIYSKADDLYYVDRKSNKDTGEVTLTTTSGKKITYKSTDKDAVDKYEPVQRINKDTGEVTYTNKAGDISYRVKTRHQESTRMAETDDAMTLVSKARHPMELVYADYANSMKSLANQARKEMVNTGKIAYDKNAKATYQDEYNSLMRKLNDALLNATRERAALRKANAEVNRKVLADPKMEKSDVKKASQQALTKYRDVFGSVSRKKRNIEITDREWEAIQAGAISENKLKQILNNTDIDALRQRATPKATTALSQAKVNRIKSMAASNYTVGEIADKLGVSKSTVSKYLSGKE